MGFSKHTTLKYMTNALKALIKDYNLIAMTNNNVCAHICELIYLHEWPYDYAVLQHLC